MIRFQAPAITSMKQAVISIHLVIFCGINADNRVFVIISDALRYEVAADLAEQLRRETKSQVDLSSMQSIFPSLS